MISSHIVDYYQHIFMGHPRDAYLPPNINLPQVTADNNNMLVGIPSYEEARSIVFGMEPHSAPGPDGFTGLFYQFT